MTFLAPWLLWCVPLAGLPVLFHLFFKVKKRPLPFSSLMFFLKVEPNLQARRKIREILLLVLRCLLILLVVLALARPVFPALGGGGRTALVLVVDNSASMGADGGGGKPRLRQALEGASALLGELKPGDLAALVPAVDERTAVASGLGGDPAVVRAALDQVTATEAAADPGRVLRQALALLATTPAPAREIHIFTDAQEGEWGRPAGEWGAVPPGVQVVVHRVGTGPRPGADVAVAAVHPPLTRIIAGRPARSGVVLVNHGAEPATVQLRVTDDQGAETVRPVSVPAHGNVEVPVVLTPAQAGLHHALVRIEGDGFAGDDRAGLAFACGDRAAVLLSGDPRTYGLLPVALAPDGTGAISGLAPMAVPAADLEREIAERRPALVVLTWADLAARTVGDHPDLPAFKAYVGGGGALLVVPGVAGLEGGGVAPDWLGAAPTRDERLTPSLPALVLAADAACFAEIRDGAGVVDVQGVRIARAVPLKVGTGRATFGLSDGRALLVETAFGKGRVFSCGLAFHPAWSSLPLKGWSLAMVQGLALPPPLAADRVLRLTAGQGLPAGSTGVVRIATLAGGPGAWNGPADQAPVFARAGVYALTSSAAGAEPARIVTVAAAPGEGIPVYLDGPALPALAGLAQRVLPGGDAAAAVADWRRSRRGSDLTPWCVVLAILAWLAEGLIGTAGIAKPAAPAPGAGAAPGRTPERDLVCSAAIFWLPQVPPLLLAALVALVIVALVVADRRLRARLGAAGGWLLLAPRIGVAVLLVLALLDPTVRSEHRDSAHGRLALLIDTSSSMDVADDGQTPRLARARGLAARIAAAAPSGVTVTTLAFDTRIRGPLAAAYPPGERPGDPGVVLQGAAADPALAGAVAVVALTDGGDEPFTLATPPAVPLSIVGVGAPDGAALPGDNLAVAGVTAPATVEARLDFTIVADLAAAARSPAFAARLADVPVVLQRAEGAGWKDVATLRAALGNGRAQVTFAQTADSPGLRRYRVALPELPGELSLLDNTRTLAIDVREQSLHVLFFTRELGADFKSLRQELARDPGVSFTGLFRITGDRYTLQGDRLDGDAALEKGFPTSAEALRRYGCVVLGAFPASGWSEAEMAALTAYVEQGGAAVFLGGERAFAAGGYASTPLAPLLPWNLSGAGGLLRGTFPVGVPATAGGQPAVAGLQALLAGAGDAAGGAVLESVNDVGPLRPGATALLESVVAGRPLAVAAIQPYGRGKSVGIATNTLWRLARAGGDGTTAYGRFWRQLVRHAADAGDASHLARVQWDRERYQPGDEAVATITVLAPPGAAPRLAATLAVAAAGATSETPVPLEAAAGQAGSLRARVRFGERGEYRFRLTIAQPGQADDTYDKTFAIAPRLGEGNRLAVDAAMLSAAAAAAGGVYAPEQDLEPLLAHLRTTLLGKPVTSDLALVGGDPWYLLAFLALVVGEWWLRRRRHLL